MLLDIKEDFKFKDFIDQFNSASDDTKEFLNDMILEFSKQMRNQDYQENSKYILKIIHERLFGAYAEF